MRLALKKGDENAGFYSKNVRMESRVGGKKGI
jgi:hypothetical protein